MVWMAACSTRLLVGCCNSSTDPTFHSTLEIKVKSVLPMIFRKQKVLRK